MTDENKETQEVEAPEAATEQEESQESEIKDLATALKVVEKLRREAASKRVKNKELEEKAKNWQDHLDSQKTELEKAQEEANRVKQEVEALRKETKVSKLVAKYGIPEEFHEFLVGESDEELEAKAKKLAALKKKNVEFFAGPRGTGSVPNKAQDLNSWFGEWWKEVDAKSAKTTF